MSLVKNAEVLPIMGRSAYLTDYFNYASSQTDAPWVFHLGMAMTGLGAVTPLHAKIYNYGGRWLHAPVWGLLVGRSTLDRKSTCVEMLRDILDSVDPDLDAGVSPGSGEAFLDHLINKPTQILFCPEYSGLLKMTMKEIYKTIRQYMTEAYDGGRMGRNTKNADTGGEAIEVRFSLAAGITPVYLEENTDEADVTGGFLSRHSIWWGESEYDMAESYPNPEGFNRVVQHLHRIASLQLQSGAMGFTVAAQRLWHDWCGEISAACKTPLGAGMASAIKRSEATARKYALLFSIERGDFDPVNNWPVDETALSLAIDVANLQMRGASNILADLSHNKFRKIRRSLLRFVSDGGKTTEAIYQHLREDPREIELALRGLRTEGRLNPTLIGAKPGYFAKGALAAQVQSGLIPTDPNAGLAALAGSGGAGLYRGAPIGEDNAPRIAGASLQEMGLIVREELPAEQQEALTKALSAPKTLMPMQPPAQAVQEGLVHVQEGLAQVLEGLGQTSGPAPDDDYHS